MKVVDKRGAVEFFSRVESVRTRGSYLAGKKMKVRTVLRQGSFSGRAVNAVAAEGVARF